MAGLDCEAPCRHYRLVVVDGKLKAIERSSGSGGSVAPKMGSTEVLYPLFLACGKPEYLLYDNGSEFIAGAMQAWLHRVGAKPIHVYPGPPWENDYNERFNGTLRRKVLNAEWFATTKQAQTVVNQ